MLTNDIAYAADRAAESYYDMLERDYLDRPEEEVWACWECGLLSSDRELSYYDLETDWVEITVMHRGREIDVALCPECAAHDGEDD